MLLSDDPDFALAFGAGAFAQQLNVTTFDALPVASNSVPALLSACSISQS
jgi:hypothetical protein